MLLLGRIKDERALVLCTPNVVVRPQESSIWGIVAGHEGSGAAVVRRHSWGLAH